VATNDIKFNVKNGLSVGASGFEVINTAGEWVGASGPGQSPYGATGAQGTYGASGITGDAGIDGASGATGIEGTQGATGIEGYQGATGSQGTQGDTYRYYASGSSVSTSLAPGFYDGFSNGLEVDPEFEVGDKVKIIDQTSGSSLVYYGEIFDVQYAGGFGFNHRVIIESISGTPIGGTSTSWLIQASATQGASGADGYQGATGSQGSQGDDGAIKLQHTYEWTDDQLQWRGNAYAGGVSPSVSRLEFLSTDAVYGYLASISPGTKLVIDWNGLAVATVTTIGTVQGPTAYTDGRHYLQISANPDGQASGGYASTDSTDVLMIGDGPRNQGFRGAGGDQGVQGSTGVVGIDGASGVQGITGQQGLDGATGATGVAGIDGASGPTGEIGATGAHGARYHTTSTDNLDFGTYFTTSIYVADDNLNYSAGQTIIITDLAHAGQHFHATVNTWDALTKELNFTVTDFVGTISSTSWEINLSAAEGQLGASGATGITGDQGLDGASGSQGSSFGTQGATGADGDTGIDGASGAQGYQGATGATGVRGTVGYDGDQGIIGDDGVQGATGIKGSTGAFGEDGEQGIDGEQGYQGATGSIGTQGDDGDQGYQGASGATGLTGATGAQGGDGSSTVVQFDTSYGHYGAHQTISSGSNGTNTILSGTVGYIESAITTAEMATYANSGLSMFGVRLDADIPATTNRIGLGTSGIDVNNALGMYDDQSQGFQQDGTVWINGIQTDALGISWGVGDLVEVAVNYNTGVFWARVNGGAWSKGGDPATNTNGSSFLLAQPYSYPAVSTLDGAVFELITTPQYDVPSGYTYLGNGAPTNTGISGSTGATGAQGAVGNAGFDADQLTYGTPRGAWDIGTYYYVDDIVVTIAPSPDSHRCIVPNIGNDPDTTSGYWVTTAYAGASGASGIDGASGVTGQVGATGAAGYDQLVGGATGPAGATGIIGTDAATGPTGSTGATGATGIVGIDGASGADGYQGASGATGAGGLQFKATADGTYSVLAEGAVINVDFLADPDTGSTTYNYSVGQSVIIAKDINNYMVADVTGAYGSFIEVIVTKAVGTASSVTGWVVNLDGAVGWIGASGATGVFGASGVTGDIGTTGGNGAAYSSINATVSSFPGYTGLDNAFLIYPTLMGSFLRVEGPLSGITAGMTVTYGGHTYTVYDYIESGNSYSQLTFTDYPVTLGAIPPGASIVIEGYGAATNTGYQGSTGAQGIDGASGATGITGASGAQGIDGASGPQGATGSQGTDGASGVTGASGSTGISGATGFSLASGSTGLSGTSQQTVDIFASNMVGTAKYIVQGVDGSTNVQATEVIFTHNAGAVYLTEYATLRTGSKVMDVTAALSGGVVSLKVTPTSSPTTVSWVREDVQGRIGGTTVTDDGSNVFSSRTHADSIGIPLGKAYVYVPAYFSNLIDFSTLASAHSSITVDAPGIGPQNPAVGTVDSWDGAVAVLTIVSGNFQSRDDLDKITYGY